ncbi:hypothetical protein HMI49_08335 [Corallococcus exercitus]|uniref:Uncharacterized protein n=1 Tax=Corallococcus exercitus TaxID=2316736 RepID=A0A7Y4KG47_9BACT|nr:hypothetical protein [Corallococcus exercitus]NOK33198.1 hypothetical protein [Corallococcus exercitus]
MTPALSHTGREALRETRFAVAAVVCAAVLAAFLGMAGPRSGLAQGTHADVAASWTAEASRPSSSPKLGGEEAGLLHGSHVGAPQPGPRDQVDRGGVSLRPPTPHAPRWDTLRALLARYDARMLAHAQGLLARALPSRLTPLADRPRTVNCPAQGPPVQG